MTDAAQSISDVLEFWFAPETQEHWFASTADFDALVEDRLADLYDQAISGELGHWRSSRDGRLALAILLDQVPRMIFRDTARAYVSDGLARELAYEAIDKGDDVELAKEGERHAFLYLPLMHQESILDQRKAVELYTANGPESGLEWARHHHDIIARFGRFPHRNAILGRVDTLAETDLKDKKA